MRPACLASTASLTIPPRRVRYERSFCPARHKPAGQLLTLSVTLPADFAATQREQWAALPILDQLLDHLVGAGKDRLRNRKSECLGRLKIDYHLEFGWRLDR
jgi:hypothetical protein